MAVNKQDIKLPSLSSVFTEAELSAMHLRRPTGYHIPINSYTRFLPHPEVWVQRLETTTSKTMHPTLNPIVPHIPSITAKDADHRFRPLYAPSKLAAQALLATPENTLSLRGIFEWVMARYPFYQTMRAETDMIRELFVDLARALNQLDHLFLNVVAPHSGESLWRIRPAVYEMLYEEAFKEGPTLICINYDL